MDGSLVALVDLRDAYAKLARERLGQRLLQYPSEPVESGGKVVCQPVVVGYAPKLQLVAGDDAEHVIV